MIARIITYLFYAIVFFLLGVWSSDHLNPLSADLDRAGRVAVQQARAAWVWARGTAPGQVAAPKVSAAPAVTLDAARADFARGDLSAATDSYTAFLAAHPDDPDALGELGNVYFNSGRTAEAAAAFHQAAITLIARGDRARALALVSAIRLGAPDLADDLERRLAVAP
jgi:tetratricopeptide (TPR) repeat protein